LRGEWRDVGLSYWQWHLKYVDVFCERVIGART